MSPWRKLWLKALSEGEVELRLDSLLEAQRARNSLYSTIRPARGGKGSQELQQAAQELELKWDGGMTIRIQKKAMQSALQEKVAKSLESQSFESISPEQQSELERMARAALEQVEKKIPYYKREEAK
jgi:hypothetical protein